MTIVDLRGIVFKRGGKPILRGVDWTIGQGEAWALIGANGSGKTTLLKILTGYEWPTEGTVTVLGKRYGQVDLREHRKAIGWVSTSIEHRIPGGDTALEVAASGHDASLGVYRGLSDGEWERARRALVHTGAERVAGQSFQTLSQGEQQRVLIARALANNPALIVLDEPCAGLDPVARRAFLDDLAAFHEADHAPGIVLVTHHVEEIGPWITHGLALRDGEVCAAGTIGQILTAPVMSRVLNHPCEVVQDAAGYRLQLV